MATIAYGIQFFSHAQALTQDQGYSLVNCFFLLTFAAAIPATVSGGIAERAKFNRQLGATFLFVGFPYPRSEGLVWNRNLSVQDWLQTQFGTPLNTISPLPSWCMPSAVGSLSRQCCSWVRAGAIPTGQNDLFRSWRSAPGS